MDREMTPKPSPDGPSGKCPECQGRGWRDGRCLSGEQAMVCQACNGKGFNNAGGECYGCHGTGRIETRTEDKIPCTLCEGAGVYPIPSSMKEQEFAYRPGRKK